MLQVRKCSAFRDGKCVYGARCLYAHSPNEMRTREINIQLIRKLKAEMGDLSDNYYPPSYASTASSTTDAADTDFEHMDPCKFKVKLCEKFAAKGSCPYMDRCMFAHGASELRTAYANSELSRRMRAMMGGMKKDKSVR